ncbi:MAG: hypothetical protein VST71_12530 [Nitrospirota bacterium]|nr:hypothetical protein [Nitrospirota bacterium]
MDQRIQTSDELTKVFDDGSVFDASENDLNRYLKHLCSGHVPNEMVRHREMNRCQVINTIKTFRFINSVERANKIFTVIIIILTVITALLSYYSFVQSSKSQNQIERIITIQEDRVVQQREYFETLFQEQEKTYKKTIETQNILINDLKKNYLLTTTKEEINNEKSD